MLVISPTPALAVPQLDSYSSIENKLSTSVCNISFMVESSEDKLISMDGGENFFEKSTSNCTDKSMPGNSEPVTCESIEQSASECLESVVCRSPKQFMSENFELSTSESPQQFISKSPKQLMSRNSEQSTSESFHQYIYKSPKQFISRNCELSTSESPKQFMSRNCELSTSESPQKPISKSPNNFIYENSELSIFESPQQSPSKSPNHFMSVNSELSTFESPQQSPSKSPNHFMSVNFELSTSESPQQSPSKSPNHFMSVNSELYTFESPQKSSSKSPNNFMSVNSELSTFESPQQSPSKSPNHFMSVNSELSTFESPQQSPSKSPNHFMSVNSELSTFESPQQSPSKSPNNFMSVNSELSTFESPQQSPSKSPEKSTSEYPESNACKSPEKPMVECPVPSTSSGHANSIQWVVGYFEDENVYSVIPSNWLLNEKGCWFSKWPNSSYKTTIEARIINASEPAKTWKYYAVQIIKRYDTYQEAEEETFLCAPNSDQNNFGRGKRKKLSNIRQIDLFEDDSDDEKSETDASMKSKVYLKNNSSIEQKSSTNDSLLVTQNTKTSSNDRLTTNERTVNRMNGSLVLNKNNNISNPSINNTKRGNQGMASFHNCIFKCIYRINDQLDKLDKLLNSGSLYETQPKTLDQPFLSLFPMKEIKDILSIDSRLINCTEFEEKFIFFIISLNCTSVKDFVKQSLSRLFTNSLATNCTWFGFKGKFELKKLKMLKIMNDVSSATFTDHTDNIFKLFVKEWFKHGKKRHNRELNKKSRAITSA